MTRRAYAMVTVVLLSMVVGLVAAVLLERMSTQHLVVRRQLDKYRVHHFERGVREVVAAWISSLYQQPIKKMLEEDGHALDMELPDGSVAALYLFEGQGSLLATPDSLTAEQREDGAAAVRALWDIVGTDPPADYFRPVGPLAVSVQIAPEPVLQAIGAACGDARAGAKLARSLMEKRASGQPIADQDLAASIDSAGFDDAGKERARRLLSAKTDLWNAVIDVYGPGGRGPVVRYGGRFTMPGEFNSKTLGSMQSLGPFLTWEEIPLDDAGSN
jgi:hypothetical protein